MAKRKQDHIDGHDPWEIEIAYMVEHLELDPTDARAWVVIRWMSLGDLRPLAAEIKKQGTALDGAILMSLERIINEGQLTVKRKRGAPIKPAKSIRDLVIKFRHANRTIKSAEAIQEIAKDFNISDELVRRAIRQRRKSTN